MRRILPAAVPVLLLTACGSAPERQNAAPRENPGLPPAQVNPATAGTISGTVRFSGAPPAVATLDMSSNPNCERQHKEPVKAETAVVNRNGTLRYTFVWIRDGLPKARWNPPAEPARLDQRGCVYGPHVLGIMTGQQLEILNEDPINHNVHAESRVNPAWNESQPPRAEHKFKVFNEPEVMFPMTCSVHPWMRSWIAVVPHPYFAVTGEDGTFTLKGVPPGTYTVEAVHEQFGRKQGVATLAASGTATVDFGFGN